MHTTVPIMPLFNRRRGRLSAAFGFIAAEKGEAAAHVRLWIAKLALPAAVALGIGSYFAGQVRGNNISHQVARNTHALICAGVLPPLPPGYRPAYGMPAPVSAPCPPVPEVQMAVEADAP